MIHVIYDARCPVCVRTIQLVSYREETLRTGQCSVSHTLALHSPTCPASSGSTFVTTLLWRGREVSHLPCSFMLGQRARKCSRARALASIPAVSCSDLISHPVLAGLAASKRPVTLAQRVLALDRKLNTNGWMATATAIAITAVKECCYHEQNSRL